MPGNVFRSILASNCRKADRFQAKRERGAKRRLHRFRFSGRIRLSDRDLFPALPDTGPPSTAGFVFLDGLFSTAGAVPANLPVGRDLTIRRKIENGRYYCAFCRSKAHHRIRAPRRAPEAAAEGTCGQRQKRGQPGRSSRSYTRRTPCPCTTARPAGDARQIAFEKRNPLAESLGRFYEGNVSQTENNHVSQTKQDDQRRRNGLVSEGDGGDALIW
jgi:hypothetical protein